MKDLTDKDLQTIKGWYNSGNNPHADDTALIRLIEIEIAKREELNSLTFEDCLACKL